MQGRVALITGAAGDLGRAAAVRLAAAGAVVVLSDLERASDGLERTAGLCADAASLEHRPSMVCFDVTDQRATVDAVETVTESVGVPDAVFNNAGYQGRFANTADYDVDDFRTVLEVNVVGVFSVLQACANAMLSSGRPGAIVNTASMAGVGGAPNMSAYSASKAAVIGLTKAAAKDLAPGGIRVNAISPAFIGPGVMWDRQVQLQAETDSQYYGDDVETVARQMIDQVPLRRFGSVDEVASTVLFLLSDDASYLTGINIEIAGGAG